MISALSARIARSIKEAAPESPQSFEVLKYAISFLLNAFFIIGSSLLISVFTGRVAETAIILVAYAFLRQMSGGLHLKSGLACILISTLAITGMSLIDMNQIWVTRLTIVSMALAAVFAPSRIDKQTRIPKKYYPYLKIASVLLISSGLAIKSPSLSIAFFIQSLTLIRVRR